MEKFEITLEVKKKIEAAAKQANQYESAEPEIVQFPKRENFIKGAIFGYSLAAEEKNEKLEKLKSGMFHALMCVEQEQKISSLESAIKDKDVEIAKLKEENSSHREVSQKRGIALKVTEDVLERQVKLQTCISFRSECDCTACVIKKGLQTIRSIRGEDKG